MEAFRLKRNAPSQSDYPVVRLSIPYHRLLCRIKEETGIPLGRIIEQCIDYALQNSGDWESELLDFYTRPKTPAGCPLLDKGGGNA